MNLKNKILSVVSAAVIVASSAVSPAFATSLGTFTNTYVPDAVSVVIDGFTKVLEGKDLSAGDFTFVLSIEPDFETTEIEFEDITVTNAEDGTITFDAIEFDYCGTYTFTVSEVDDEKTGYTYDDMVATGTITISCDDETDALVAEIEYPEDTEFNNSYQAVSNSLLITATKTFSDPSNTGKTLSDFEFNFQITDENGEVVAAGTNDDDGLIEFSEIEITEEGTYIYTISEVAGDNSHITYDTTTFTITIVVEDVDGELQITSIT